MIIMRIYINTITAFLIKILGSHIFLVFSESHIITKYDFKNKRGSIAILMYAAHLWANK